MEESPTEPPPPLPSRTGRVGIHPGRGSERTDYDRSALLAGARDALVAAPSLADGSEEEAVDDDDDAVFLTGAFRDWECHYLRRLAKRVHRLVCAQLNHRSEEALFMLFIEHDRDMDGVVGGEEAAQLLELIEEATPGVGTPASSDGSISFVALLNWYSGAGNSIEGGYRDSSTSFGLTSLAVGLLGSGMVRSDARLERLGWAGLRRNVLGYRRVLQQLRALQEQRSLRPARELESREGLLAAMPTYLEVLSREFEGDGEHFFELFSEADTSGCMALGAAEVESLLRRLDGGASEADLRRYLSEINVSEGPLSFASLMDWWDQARTVPNSLVAEKGAGLVAGLKAEALRGKLSNLFFETAVRRRWREASQANRLPALRQAYCRTLSEVRDYKMQRDLRALEVECARL